MATLSVSTVLGEFRRPGEGAVFEGQLGDVAVGLDVDDEHAAAALAQRVSTTVGELAGFARRVAVELADAFAPEGPDEVEVWEHGETVISAAEFARRLRLDRIAAASEGDIELSFDDDGMFGGHSIRAWVDAAGTVTDAQIAG
ncbi:DUF2262 domain-containing protein [Dactylosporangium sp. NPDC051541]|uniref:DUF2262 domain-containing protein n=1 Tax=Dactylosporangium sp. NPDC051541 TaxID=3363977 RepID=UPI00378D560C